MVSKAPSGQDGFGPDLDGGQASGMPEPTLPAQRNLGQDDNHQGTPATQPNSPSLDDVGLLPLFSDDGVTFQLPMQAGAGGTTNLSTSPQPIIGNASAFVINVSYDASVANAPAGFTSTISSVVQYLGSVITTPITVNIQVGYGEVNGTSLGSNALGESETFLSSFSYNSIKNALSSIDPSAASSLPSSAPGTMWISTSEAKALGLSGASSNVDGYAGFSSIANIFDYDKSNGITAGQYDFFGVVAHEFTEVMGRIDLFGVNIGGTPNSYDLLDMYHYTSPGVHTYTGTTANYFSVDGGTTNLNNFNTNANGDSGDWAASAGNDSFLAFSNSGVVNAVSQSDITEMNALGYGVSGSSNTSMKVDYFHAVDSKTGDYFNGIVYDNAARYSVGSTVQFSDQLGGTWTYTIQASLTADSTHQSSFYAGKVYDTYYYDADLGLGNTTNYGFQGYNYGSPTDTQNYSGSNYLGSDGDYVSLNGSTQRFAYNFAVPEAALMKVDYFHAVDSKTGDYFNGIVYDNAGKYSVGSTVQFSDQLGGTWTYTIQASLIADSTHQSSFYTGKVYDTYYYDADLGIGNITNYGFLGYNYGSSYDTQYYSGSNYLGSDGDYVSLNGSTQRFAYNFAVPEAALMKVDYFHAVDSKTGDYFNGIVYDNAGKYSVGSTVQFSDQLGGTWTYTIQVSLTADSTHQSSFYAGKVYDTYYYDADLGIGNTTNYGFLGYNYGSPTDTQYYSGTNYLGSDGDYVTLNGVTQRFAYNYTVPSLASTAANADLQVTADATSGAGNANITKSDSIESPNLAHTTIELPQTSIDETHFDSAFAAGFNGQSESSLGAANLDAYATLGYQAIGSAPRGHAVTIEDASTASAFGLLINHMAAFAPSDAASSQPLMSDLQSVTEQPLLTLPHK